MTDSRTKLMEELMETNVTTPLLPCPFCGGEAEVRKLDLSALDDGWQLYGVWCINDLHAEEHGGYQHGHYIDNYATEAEAVASWNTRADSEEKEEMMHKDQIVNLCEEHDQTWRLLKTKEMRVRELENNLRQANGSREHWKAKAEKASGELADIKAKVEDEYMKLPVDADLVPIRPGDEVYIDGLKALYEVFAVGDGIVVLDGMFMEPADECRHVKPDTVESLLQELADEVWEASCTCQTTWSDSGLDGIAERYAERIRKAVEG